MTGCIPFLQLAILRVIAELQPICGYRIAKILIASGFNVEEAAVYTILQRLRSKGLIEPIGAEIDGRRVKRYRLTEKGKRELKKLQEEYRRLSENLERLEKLLPNMTET